MKTNFLSRWKASAQKAAAGADANYLATYKLSEPPFVGTHRPALFWEGGPFAEASSGISAYFAGGANVVLLKGAEGVGKTFFLQMLEPDQAPQTAESEKPVSYSYFRGMKVAKEVKDDSKASHAGGSVTGVHLGSGSGSRSGSESSPSAASASTSVGSVGGNHAGAGSTGGGSKDGAKKKRRRPRMFRGQIIDDSADTDASDATGSVDAAHRASTAPSQDAPPTEGTARKAVVHGSTIGTQGFFRVLLESCELTNRLPAGSTPTAEQLVELLQAADVPPLLVVIDEFEKLPSSAFDSVITLIDVANRLAGKLHLIVAGRPDGIAALAGTLDASPPVCELRTLRDQEVKLYLAHRMRACGLKAASLPMSSGAVVMMTHVSEGRAGKLNPLAHATFTIAAAANLPRVTCHHVILAEKSASADGYDTSKAPPLDSISTGWRGRLAMAAHKTAPGPDVPASARLSAAPE